MIELDAIGRSLGGRPVLHDVSLRVDDGEIVGLLGPNGAGKTTAIRLLLGLLRPHAGAARVERPVGYLPETLSLYDGLTVAGYLRFLARAKRLPRAERGAEVDRVLEEVALAGLRRRPVARLSRGQRQRLGLAQALLGAPRSLVLDEPTTGLDPRQVVELRALLQRAAGAGSAVLLSTHVLAEAAAVCDRVVVIAAGRVVGEEVVTSAAALEGSFLAAVARAELG